jgi:signal transduction histidine kinase
MRMIKLRTKLTLFNLLSKLVFTVIFVAFMPYIIDRINIIQTDNELVNKREEVIDLISRIGIEPFITSDTGNVFGSYNILKEEFISIERVDLTEDWNFIEVSQRLIDNETINYRVLNYSLMVDGQTYLLEIGKSLTSILITKKNIKTIIWIFLIFIIVITLLSDLFYTHKILQPLDLIIKKLKGTSSTRLFDKTPVITTTSDFNQLDQTLRELMNKIDELFQKEKDITVNISHELMTPISVLRSKLENLLLQETLDIESSARIEESLATLHRLKTLVNSLLLIARIDSRQYLKDESVSINELIGEIINEISPIAVDADILLKEQFVGDLLFTKANKSLLFSMFYNIVNNAVKNTPTSGSVIIKGGYNNNRFEVIITDTGIGMSKEQMNNMFSRFNKKLNLEEENSTGIGLAIAKSIADFHKIDISVESNILKGTTFLFLFPENS